MQIEFSVPGLLRDCCGGRQRFVIEAATIDDAVASVMRAYPLLKRHVYDEAGNLRKHVLLYYNEDNVAWLARRDAPLKEGDRLAIVQAVSGG